MADNAFKDLVNGIGAISEMAALLRENLIKNGFTRKEACDMVCVFLQETFKGARGNG